MKQKHIPEWLNPDLLEKRFKIADIANWSCEERRAYEESVKQYRDLKNVTDTAFHDGEKKSDIKVILNGYQEGLSVELLASLTELSVRQVQEIIQRSRNQKGN